MAYPIQLAAKRDYPALLAALTQLADTALLLDTRVKAIQHAYAGVLAADYEANAAPTGTGGTYAQLMADLATFLGTPAWTRMMQYADQLRDIGR